MCNKQSSVTQYEVVSEMRSLLDLCVPTVHENLPKNATQSCNHCSEKIKLLRNKAIRNNEEAETIDKCNYDKHARPHNFIRTQNYI